MLTARRIRWGLIGLLFLGALLIPTNTEPLGEYLPTRGVMLIALVISFGATQLVAFQWIVLPCLAILLFGSPVTQLFAGEVLPLLWWFSGLMFWALSGQELLELAVHRLKGLAQSFSSLADVPRHRFIRFHVPNWIIAGIVITVYTVFVPVVVHDQTAQQTLWVALFGSLAGCVIALLTGRWRLYAVFLVSVVLAVTFLEREDYAAFLGFSWLTAYVVACIMKDPSTIHRSLVQVRQAAKLPLKNQDTPAAQG